MKNRFISDPEKILLRLAILIGIALITSQNSAPASAQSGGGYELTWNVMANGGGLSVGGSYALDGTIGQGGAGAPSGGVYTLAGGFWTSVPNVGSNILKTFLPMIETGPH